MEVRLSAQQESRVTEALRSGACQSPETLHEQDEWLITNRQAIDAKIRRSIAELERGEGIGEGELAEHLKRLKAQSE
jgi:hypothetical protein